MFFKRSRIVLAIAVSFLSLTKPPQAQVQVPNWTDLFPTGTSPSPRYGQTAVYDENNNRMAIFGGYDNTAHYQSDVWVLSTANGVGATPAWTQLAPTGTDSTLARGYATAVYDTTNNLMMLFAGRSPVLGEANDLWILTNANGLGGTPAWTVLSPNPDPNQTTNGYGGLPAGRNSHTAVYDAADNIMTIFGGYDGSNDFMNDVWVLSTANGVGGTPGWTQLSPTPDSNYGSPEGRCGQSAVYDTTNNIMTIFGGFYGYNASINYFNDVWVLSHANGLGGTPAWTEVFPIPDPVYGVPTTQNYQTAIYDPQSNRMIIFGGTPDLSNSESNDVWALSHANGLGGTPAWKLLLPAPDPYQTSNGYGGLPPTRDSHSAVYNSIYNQMIIFGGQLPDLNDVWVLNDASGVIRPAYSNLPAVKMFISDTTDTLFNLEDYNTGSEGTSWNLISEFNNNNLAGLNGSYVVQSTYDLTIFGTNSFQGINSNGMSPPATNKFKYSTYKINKLPHVGLTVGSSYILNLTDYTYNLVGAAIPSSIPASFGMSDALTTDNPAITATWISNTAIQITATAAIASVANVFVTASPNTTEFFGVDQDKERIQVYTNLLPNSTFSTANDISSGTYWGGSALEIPPGRTTLATESWVSSYTDSVGTEADGVVKFTFADANDGVKATPGVSNWINITNGQWYIFRMHVVADSANNSHQSFLFGYTNIPAGGVQTDIGANLFFGVPTVWTWQETPLLAHGSGTSGYPQFQLKAGGAGSIYVDEVQILNATPALLEARSNTKFHYLYGEFTAGSDTTGWGQQIYTGAAGYPGISVNNGLVLTFDGTAAEGIKWTANNNVQGPHAYSFPVSEGYDVNVGLTVTINSGSFNSLGFVLLAAYGVQTSGQQDIGVVPSNLIASAGVGIINSGTYYAEGQTINPYYQGQFGIRNDLAGVLTVTGVDVSTDHDDPYYGDASLFPTPG